MCVCARAFISQLLKDSGDTGTARSCLISVLEQHDFLIDIKCYSYITGRNTKGIGCPVTDLCNQSNYSFFLYSIFT